MTATPKNERRALRQVETTPAALPPLAQAFLENRVNYPPPMLKSYRIQFSTPTVGPQGLPEFPYVTSQIQFSAVVYTSVIQADSFESAVARIRHHWPKAIMQEAEEGVSTFRDSDTHLTSHQFGAVRVKEVTPWYRRSYFKRT